MANIIADHGHDVTLFRPYYINHNTEGLVKNTNITIIDYFPDHYEELLHANSETFPMFWDDPFFNHPVIEAFITPRLVSEAIEKTATQLLRDGNILQELRAKKYDVAIKISGIYLAHLIDVPCIPIMPAVRFTNTMDIFGQPSLLGYIQHSGSKMAPDAGFLDRLNDVYRNFLFDLNTDSNSWITVDLNKPKTALPEDYEKILQERESMVLISFGSVIRSFQMPDHFKAGIIKMFGSLPDVTFIWKYEKDDVKFQKRLPKNVHLKKWVPQPALMADKRLKAFVTHGGLGSTTEVAYSGKPEQMIPIFGDQPYKADMLARHGGAIAFSKYDLKNPEKLTSAVRSLVYDLKYKNNAKTLLDVLSNQPIDPKQNLMKHLEFAMKFPNLRSQVPAINQVGTIAHYYLDVVAFLTILAGFSLYVLYSLLLKIIRRVVSKKF